MKHELIILQGIQGSGKTTWAKNWVKEDPKHRVRFNQDDIRNMFGVYWVPSREPLVKELHNSFLNKAMLEGYDIVLDNMNLNQKTLDEIKEIVKNAEPDEAYLLISATTKMKDCKDIIEAYSFLENYKLIFTKIDETSSLGVVLNVKEITGKSLSYFTTGQSVPDDIEIADVENLSKKLLGNS